MVTQPACYGDKGTIKVGAENIDPQYYYYIYNGNTLVNSFGPTENSDYTFSNLNPGVTYRVRVTNGDREFIEHHILQTGISISDLFRDLIKELKQSTSIIEKE